MNVRGIEYKKRNEVERAIRELEQMSRLVPDEPKTHYNLGVLYKLQDDIERVEVRDYASGCDIRLYSGHWASIPLPL